MSTTPTLPFTPRELQVLTLLANSKHNDEIATILNVSPHTAKFHVNSILVKTHQDTRLGAVIYCLKLNILNLKDLQPELNAKIAKGEIIKCVPDATQNNVDKAKKILENDHLKENLLGDIMESVDKLSMDFGNEQLSKEIMETLNVYIPL